MHTLVDDFQEKACNILGIFVPCDDMKDKKIERG